MEDLRTRSYPYEPCSSSYSQSAACLPHYPANYIDTNAVIQIQTTTKSIKFMEPGTCIYVDAPAAVVFDAQSTKRPHDYGLLGTASLGPVAQLDQTGTDDSSPAVTQCWQKFVAKLGDPAQTLTCKSPANSLLNYSSPCFPPTRSHRRKKAAAGGRGDNDLEATVEGIVNSGVHKLVERQRRNKMKALCSTLISLLPEEVHRKTKHMTLSDKLLDAIKHIRHLQAKLIVIGKKRDESMATAKPFSDSSCVYKNLQASQVRPSNVRDKFQTIRVSKFGRGIQITVNASKNQIEFSSLLMVLEEAEVDVVSATVSAINDRVFYSIHSKLSDSLNFDSAVLRARIDPLMNGNIP